MNQYYYPMVYQGATGAILPSVAQQTPPVMPLCQPAISPAAASVGRFPNPAAKAQMSLEAAKYASKYLARAAPVPGGTNVLIRMRGLPYDCTPKQVVSLIVYK